MTELITELIPYMAPSPFGNLQPAAPVICTHTKKVTELPKKPQPIPNSNMTIKTSDSLIYCLAELHQPTFAKIINMQIHHTYSDTAFKLSFIDDLRKPEYKSTLWARDTRYATLDAVETDLGKPTMMKLPTFLTLCRLLEIGSFIIIYKRAGYMPTQYSQEPLKAIIYCPDNKKWKIVPFVSDMYPPYMISNIIKPYKAISSYSASDLKQLCGQLLLEQNKNKPELYADIKIYFSELLTD